MVTHVTNRPSMPLTKGYSVRRKRSLARRAWLTTGRGGRWRTLPTVQKVVIDVMLKPEIHDPQGDAIAGACRRLGFSQVAGVRQGKRFEIELTEPVPADRMAELAADLLANPVIEEFTIEPL
jgi:phosphoribosylformylglycinamidine synthase subunit PurS